MQKMRRWYVYVIMSTHIGQFLRFCYLVLFISTLLFLQIATCLPAFDVKNNAVQYRSLRREKSHEIVIKMLRVEKLELTPCSHRFLREFVG